VIVSHHGAQASEKISLVGIPASPRAYFTLLPDRQNGQRHAERTTRRHHLLSLLSSGSINSHVTRDPLDVCSLSGRANLEPVSALLQDGIRFFQHLNPAPPTVCLTVCLPGGQRYGISTFHMIDPLSDSGGPCTPAVQQFRVSTLETYNLTACHSHRGIAFNLLNLSRSVAR